MACTERRQPPSLTSSVRPAGGAITALASLAVALLGSGCAEPTPEARGAVTAQPTAIPVITQPARIEPMGIEIEAVGTTQANESV